ncbi:MAG: polyprenyl synthetase family protein [Candidatus Marinimicrobia bacterium]|nr:polyprenyl synthetase family protein [Candidatus Neomarinimicrobiota bacterium]
MTDFKAFYSQYVPWFHQQLIGFSLPKEPITLYDPIRYTFHAGGKRIRPALLSALAQSYGISKEESCFSAMAVEMIHLFSLIHDDIMDSDDVRHGKTTIHVKWDINTAILSGDALFSLAFQTIQKNEESICVTILPVFTQVVLKICEGQSYDLAFELSNEVTVDEYLKMIELKTGYLLSGAAILGALHGKANPEDIEIIKKTVLAAGRAFQIQDDLLELTSNPENMGKSLGSDLVEKKKTFPLLTAYSLCSKKERYKLDSMLTREYILKNGISTIKEFFEDLGVIHKTEERIKQEMDTAFTFSEHLKDNQKKVIHSFINFIMNRTK